MLDDTDGFFCTYQKGAIKNGCARYQPCQPEGRHSQNDDLRQSGHMKQYDVERTELETKMNAIKSALAEEREKSGDIKQFIALIRKCKNPTEISDLMFYELIDKIVVYEAEGVNRASGLL